MSTAGALCVFRWRSRASVLVMITRAGEPSLNGVTSIVAPRSIAAPKVILEPELEFWPSISWRSELRVEPLCCASTTLGARRGTAGRGMVFTGLTWSSVRASIHQDIGLCILLFSLLQYLRE